jgi:cardiolipin synthase
VVREGASGSTAPQIKGAEGIYSKKKSERILERRAGDDFDAEHLKRFVQAEEAVTGSPLVAGNHVTLLIDGSAAYEAMFDAIREAKDHVHLETYALADDNIGHQFANLLLERSAAGILVRVIYDSVGSFPTSAEYFSRLRAGGVQVHEFHPVDDIRFWRIINRDHRKLLIVDGKVAFTGGINIKDVYSGSSSLPSKDENEEEDITSNWRDTHVRIEGPAVAEFQKLFLRIWIEKEKEKDFEQYKPFPQLNNVGSELVRVVASTGGETEYDIYKAYITAISLARERIWVTQAYFAPNDQFIEVLEDGARRGVDVRVILQGLSDHKILLHASQAHYTRLLKAGVRIYERRDRLLHAKTAVIDALWSTVGSSNLDYFSFLRNNEVNAVILGRDFGLQMEDLFEFDIGHAEEIELEKWQDRSVWKRLMEQFSNLLKYWF